MITLHDLLSNMTYGEFSQLSLGNFLPDEHENEPNPKSYKQLTSHVNLGLTALYSEFVLVLEEIYIQLDEAITTYVLSFDYAVSNTASPIDLADRYIVDTAEIPFNDNVLKVEEIYDDFGNRLFTNDDTEDLSIMTPTYRTLQVPWPNAWNVIAVQYRANHKRVSVTSATDLTSIEIFVPPQLEEALMFYVASRVFASLPGNADSSESNDYFRKYQSKIQEVRHQGLYTQPESGSWRFGDNGWV